MRLQSAIFDMDGTLLDSMPIWKDLGPNMLRSMGIEPAPDLADRVMVLTLREGAQLCKEEYGLPLSVDEIIQQIEDRVCDFYEHQVQAKPGVQKFLSLLKMEGVWMYVATNTDRHLAEAALRHAGIDQYFRGLLTCSEIGAGKNDSPEIYERAMTRLRSTKRDTVIFEDAVHAIRTAKRAGFRVCGVYDPSAEADQAEIRRLSDYYIRSFEEMFETETLE
ncbi:HAD family phosphatase [uncultured Dysosmobacter sp.]|uniref:HAD family hydrolase n=1 Tax=uncultured Dysosmobacter sp. TaxID=2591384 RepID=UPI002633698E|nr:HAD family phosphatase [uncultured Dysosmobacter sp.]